MTAEVRHELNTLLVEQVDSFAAMLEQRNLARDAAICLEQELAAAEAENAEFGRLANLLRVYVAAPSSASHVEVVDTVRALLQRMHNAVMDGVL